MTSDHPGTETHDKCSIAGVFHGVAGVARATPGLMELPSTGNGIEVSRYNIYKVSL